LLDKLKKHKYISLLKYPFTISVSVLFYEAFKFFNLLQKDTKTLIFAKNIAAMETFVYYQRYVNFSFKIKNLTVALSEYNPKMDNYTTHNFMRTNRIKPIPFTSQLNNSNLKKLENQISNEYNFIFIDIIMRIRELTTIRPYSFQNTLSIITLALKKLSKGGDLMIYVPDITNKLVLNFYIYLGTYFETGFIYDSEKLTSFKNFSVLIYKNYKGIGKEIDKFYEINEQNYKCDSEGGKNYQITDQEEAKLIGNQQPKNPPKCYLNSIVDLTNMNAVYKNYKKIMKRRYEKKLLLLKNINYLYLNSSKVNEQLQRNIVYSISYYKKIGLNVADWIDEKGLKNYFFEKTLREALNIYNPYSEKMRYGCSELSIGNYKKLDYHNKDHMNNLYIISENAYEYIEKTDRRKYKNIELVFNYFQKKLQKFTYEKYNVNINKRYVNRAWIKMYELYHKTKYFKNLKSNTVRALHICEAPGNFINSSIYYINNNTDIKNYDWYAQSLKGGDIWDEYGFIKKTMNRWDFGKDGTGDITSHNNLLHYFKKYKGIDSLVGDCGLPWSPESEKTNDLSVYQMLYALLLPKVGGNFVIKTYSVNFNLQFVSLLFTACAKYEQLYIFRSSRNIWSSEMYIVGINKKELTKKEEDNLLNISYKMSQGEIVYPVDRIPAEFGLEYEYHTQTLIGKFTEIKKFFVYLARNYKFFLSIKENLFSSLDRKNKIWLDKYMKHLPNVASEYKKFYEKDNTSEDLALLKKISL